MWLNKAISAQSPPKNAPPPRGAHDRGAQRAELQHIGGLRPKLLYERYGILENPFGVTPDPRYLYQSKTHAEASSSLIIGIECGIGFQAIIAPPGMGKTTILFHVLERFKDVARTALLFQIHGDSHDFLRYLLSELGSDAPDSSVVRSQEAINQLLVREFRSGRRTIIIIDEAQSLDTRVLETIRLLSNFETRSEKLLHIILAGQPQLARRLANPELAQLRQRISMLTTLIPFNLEDTRNYIEHRLKIASYQGPPLFTSAAVKLIWERSGGVPREINTLCFNALLLARVVEQKQVDSDTLHEVVEDLDLDHIRFDTGTPPNGMRRGQTTDGRSLGNADEDPPTTRIVKTCKAAAVSGAKTEVDDPSTRPTAFDEVDPVQLGTIAAEILSTSSGEKAEQAAVSGAKAEADDASTRPTAFDEVDPVQLGTIAAEIVSTGSREKAEQAAVSRAKTEPDEASTPPTDFDGVDLVQLGTISPKRDTTSSGKNGGRAAAERVGAESDDIVGRVFLPDRPASASHCKTDTVIFAGSRVAGAPSRETEAKGSSTDVMQAFLEAVAAQAEWMPEARHDLTSGVESELTSKDRFDLSTGIKPHPKPEIEPESGSDIESAPEVEPGVAAAVQLSILLAETVALSETARRSLWRTAKKRFTWAKRGLEAFRATIYLGASILIFLLVLSGSAWLPQRAPEPTPALFRELLSSLGLAGPSTIPVHYNPDVGVWVNVHSGLYSCPGAPLYGKTREGKFTTQGQALKEHFKTADGKVCQ